MSKEFARLLGGLLLLSATRVFADGYTTNIISGVISNNAGADFSIGNSGPFNSLQILNGGILTNVNNAYIGNSIFASNISAAAVVSGAGSAWWTTNLFLGNDGFGNMLTIQSNAAVHVWNQFVTGSGNGANNSLSIANGILIVTNATRQGVLNLGPDSQGICIQNAGTVIVDYLMMTNSTLSSYVLNNGSVTIKNGFSGGGDSALSINNGTFTVTNTTGQALMNLGSTAGVCTQNAGTVIVDRVLATNGTTSTYVLNGGSLTIKNGINFDTTAALVAGNQSGSTATFNMLGGTNLFPNGLTIGAVGGATGTVKMTGAQTVLNTPTLIIGQNGVGSFIQSNGVCQIQSIQLGIQAGSQGQFIMTGGTNSVTQDIELGGSSSDLNSTFTVNGGTLTLTNSGWQQMIVLHGSFIMNGGNVTFDRLLITNGVNSHVYLNGGTLNLINGAPVTNAGASFAIGGGTNAAILNLLGDEHDFSGSLSVSNLATLQVNKTTISGGLIINSGGKITGGGTFNSAVTNLSGGTLTPGMGGDTNTFTTAVLYGHSTNLFWVGSTNSHDMSIVSNNLSYAGSGAPLLKLDLTGYDQANNPKNSIIVLYDVVGTSSYDGTNDFFQLSDPSGPNNGLNLSNGTSFVAGGLGATNSFSIHYNYNVDTGQYNGNDIALSVIPEPVSVSLLLAAGLIVGIGLHFFAKLSANNKSF